MIEYKEKEVMVNATLVDKIICDKCGKECRMVHGIGVSSSFPFAGGIINIRSYPSANVADMSIFTAQICEDCAAELEKWIGGGEKIYPYADTTDKSLAIGEAVRTGKDVILN